MRDILTDLDDRLSDPDPVRRAQIQMKRPLANRFYKQVTIVELEDGFTIALDGKTLKTPLRHPLLVPTIKAADLLRSEWDAQEKTIDPTKMPITRLVNTAIDAIASDRQAVLDDIIKFTGSDLLCYRAETPEALVARQADLWNPVLEWIAKSCHARPVVTSGIIYTPQPQGAIVAFANALEAYSQPIALACLHTITTMTGSAILTLAFAQKGYLAEQIWTLAHLDEDWTDEQWGEDEDAAHRRKLRKIEFMASCQLFEAIYSH